MRKRISRDDFKLRFGDYEPVPFEEGADELADWAEKDHVWVAEDRRVEKTKRNLPNGREIEDRAWSPA